MSLPLGFVSCAAAVLAAAAPRPVPASHDLTFEQTTVTTIAGKPGAAGRSKVYWSGRKVRLESGDAFEPLVVLIDLDRDRAYSLDAASRTALRLDVDALRSRSHLGFAMAGDRLGTSTEDGVRTRTLDGVRVIAGHKCRGYRLRAGDTQMDVWVTDRVSIDIDAFADFLDWSGAAAAVGGLVPELRKLGGFPMETRSRVTADGRVFETRATVTSLDARKLDPALFDVPPSYAIEEETEAEPDPAP